MTRVLLAALLAATAPAQSFDSPLALPAQDRDPEWRALFNGKDLAGWETWLGKPNKAIDVPGLEKNAQGEYAGPVGLDKDPKGVFSVIEVDGKPAVRVSGEVW